MDYNYSFLLTAFILLGTLWFRYSQKSKHQHPLPPGPKGLPFIGNLFDVPHGYQWVTFSQLAKQYETDILYLNVAGIKVVVLESNEAITELLDRRSAIYSSRYMTKVIHEMVGWTWAMVFMPYDELWKERRRLFSKYFHPSDTSLHQSREVEQIHIFLNNLLDKPEEFLGHIRLMIGAITISMGYGIEIKGTHNPYVKLAERTIGHLSEIAQPGTFLVENIPWLSYIPEWFPGGGWKAAVRDLKQEMDDFLNLPFDASLKAIEDGKSTDCFVSRYYTDLPDGILSEGEKKIMKEMAGQIFIAGADTTVAALKVFFYAMVCFPDVFKKAQQEVDSVLNGRLPDHNDMESMPYLSALLKEVLRWQPIFPTGIFHAVQEDDIYKGYHIPKGSMILPNVWSLSYDPVEFPEPEVVKPERFIKDGKLYVPGRDPADAAFGFGRRSCQGRHIGESMWFICAASVLATFDISKAVDENGDIIEPVSHFNSIGTIRQAGPFICSIKPRSQESVELIRSLV